jgi:hypothetical protein
LSGRFGVQTSRALQRPSAAKPQLYSPYIRTETTSNAKLQSFTYYDPHKKTREKKGCGELKTRARKPIWPACVSARLRALKQAT